MTDILNKIDHNKNNHKERYLFVFFISYIVMMLVLIPVMINNKGLFIYYGDFNSQQIPFYIHSHDAIRNGITSWDWGTDLGSNFLGSYSFYLLGSPFFYLTLPFPSAVVPYMLPWLLALKTGVASVTAYAYARRFIKSQNACIIAGLLYAFSGFQLYNIFFNHFHDVTAFFPLLLIALEERVKNDRRGVFALAVMLMSTINYYFFTGQVTFLIIYFIIRSQCDDFRVSVNKFWGLVIESVLGCLMSCAILLPSALAIISNPRVATALTGHNMVAYSDPYRLYRIIQSFFMLPDPPARANLFSSTTARWASIAGYLPLFSMAGVIAYFKQTNKKDWMRKIIVVSIICAFIPIFNSAFYAFNGSYYARWYYMPILIMCVMTAFVIDNKNMHLSKGFALTAVVFGFFFVTGLLPTKDKNDSTIIHFGEMATYPDLFWISVIVTAIGLFILAYILYGKRMKVNFYPKVIAFTIFAIFSCSASIVWYGAEQGNSYEKYVGNGINGADNISIEDYSDEYFRLDISNSLDNYPMFWNYSCMRAFNSVVPGSIMDFYESLGITRDVASRVEPSRYALRSLLSVKYYFNYTTENDLDMPGFEYYSTQNNFDIYKNTNYIPMGFTFEYYITQSQFDELGKEEKDRILLKSLLLSDEQIEGYSQYIDAIDGENLKDAANGISFIQDCEDRRLSSAKEFKQEKDGFTAVIDMNKDNLVFFSVPYDEGFKATVNGKSAKIEKVDNGMMAVFAPQGENIEIVFKYKTPGLALGIMISGTGVILFVIYLVIFKKKIKKQVYKRCSFNYTSIEENPENNESQGDE